MVGVVATNLGFMSDVNTSFSICPRGTFHWTLGTGNEEECVGFVEVIWGMMYESWGILSFAVKVTPIQC